MRAFFILILFVSALVRADETPPARVVVSTVSEEEVRLTTPLVGVVDFDRVASLAPEVSGLIARHGLEEGAVVKKGETLVWISTDFLEQDIRIRRAEMEQVAAEADKLALQRQRMESLLKTNAASRTNYEDTLYDHKSMVEKHRGLQEQVDRLKLSLEKSRVRAPFDGIVIERLAEVGQWASPESPLARIASQDDIRIKVPVSEDLLRYLNEGDSVAVEIPALGRSLEGRVAGYAPVADLRSKSVLVKIGIPYSKDLVQNMTARVQIPASDKRRLRLLRRDAVVTNQGQSVVYAVREGKAESLPVNIVSRMGRFVGVDDSAVSAGMSVVVDGNERLKPGQAVQVVGSL
ncbi:MAG: efflux RND transporter periplasmic adaptor subunit [Chromatiales bacterium]|nr:efflux RND transporter periplasmic adaptor subunit [Chromatiales bacterium]